jgi:hypothetical protein
MKTLLQYLEIELGARSFVHVDTDICDAYGVGGKKQGLIQPVGGLRFVEMPYQGCDIAAIERKIRAHGPAPFLLISDGQHDFLWQPAYFPPTFIGFQGPFF